MAKKSIIIIDEKGYIKQANPTCENMVGLSEDNLKKMNFLNIIYTKEKTNFKQSLAENPVTFLRDCFVLNSLRNKKIPVDISFALIETENSSDAKQFVGVIRDIRAQKENYGLMPRRWECIPNANKCCLSMIKC